MNDTLSVVTSKCEPPTIDVNAAHTPPLDWLAENREAIEAALDIHGALYLAGCGIETKEDFSLARDILFRERAYYHEKATPRTHFGSDIYSSTDFPADQAIRQHNENSYTLVFPGKLLFGCFSAPTHGGATTVADVRAVLNGIDPAAREQMAKVGWMLTRNYRKVMGLPWQTAFGTEERGDVERYCVENDIRCTWDGDTLRTTQVRPGIVRHPRTTEPVWFNHAAFWSEWALKEDVREILVSEFGSSGLAFNTSFGDGTEISREMITAIGDSYDRNTRRRAWNTGDLLLVDNVLSSHGRDAFVGDRHVIVAMGDPVRQRDVLHADYADHAADRR